jgi:hypothetical protein
VTRCADNSVGEAGTKVGQSSCMTWDSVLPSCYEIWSSVVDTMVSTVVTESQSYLHWPVIFEVTLTSHRRLHDIHRAWLHWKVLHKPEVLAVAKLGIFTAVYCLRLTKAGVQWVVLRHHVRVQISAHLLSWLRLPGHCHCLLPYPLYFTTHGSWHHVAWATDSVVK